MISKNGKIQELDKLLLEIGVNSYDKVKVYTEDNKIIIKKFTKEEECEDWIKYMYKELQEDKSVFIANHYDLQNNKNINVMIDLDFERMEIYEADCSSATRALHYAYLKKYIVPKEVVEYIQNEKKGK